MVYETVMDIDQLLARVRNYQPDADFGVIRKAYEFSVKVHEGQRRRSGEPYVQHPIAVAGVLTMLKTDVTAVVAGLLHDTLEDTVATTEELEREFGKDVVHLVDGVTKIGKITFRSSEEKQAENFRKMVLSMADDIRVVIIKLADRLHNMRTLEHLDEWKRQEISWETLEIYAPLANRMGIGWVKNELEDLCLKYLKPDVYEMLRVSVAKQDQDRQQYIQEVTTLVQKALDDNGLAGTVYGRPKHLYGVYQKMNKQSISFEEVYDLTALRVITDTKMNCYTMLGVIHSLWRPLPGRFKDYISIPKSNFYQSLHTTVVGPKGEHVEFQIRTDDMHRVAEYGIAAHWKYKEQGQVDDKDSKVFSWLRQFVEWHKDLPDNRQFMASVKLELFHDVVYVFTPKGMVKELPKGATPVDFAYAIHTEVGDHCVGAKLNGKIVPLRHQMESGDTIEIMTSPTQTPHKDWLKFVRTSRAKTKIKHWIKVKEQARSLEIGRQLLEAECRRHGLAPAQIFKSEQLLDIAKQKGHETVAELIATIGFGHLSAAQIVEKLVVNAPVNSHAEEPTSPVKVSNNKRLSKSIQVKGARDLLMQLSRCCNPVPGDKILGYITRGRGLTIHAIDCPNLEALDYDRSRLVEVEWDTTIPGYHPVKIAVIATDKTGVLANVSSAIAEYQINIRHAEILTREDQKAELDFVVEISDEAHVNRVLKAIERVEGVISARRVRSWQEKS